MPGDAESVHEGARRLESEIAWLRKLCVEADGRIGDPDPIKAIEDALVQGHFDEILPSTPPAGFSSVIHADLPHHMRRHTSTARY